MAASKEQVLRLYRSLLREGKKFPNYNFRMYALRRVKDAFKENRNVRDAQQIQELMTSGQKNLDTIKRQVVIGNLYKADDLVIERAKNN